MPPFRLVLGTLAGRLTLSKKAIQGEKLHFSISYLYCYCCKTLNQPQSDDGMQQHGCIFLRIWVGVHALRMRFADADVPVCYKPSVFTHASPGKAFDGGLPFDLANLTARSSTGCAIKTMRHTVAALRADSKTTSAFAGGNNLCTLKTERTTHPHHGAKADPCSTNSRYGCFVIAGPC